MTPHAGRRLVLSMVAGMWACTGAHDPGGGPSTGSIGLPISATSGSAWQNFALPAMSGPFTLEFDAVPNGASVDALTTVSLGQASNANEGAVVMRFNASGGIDAMNGASFATVENVRYAAGTSYHFRVSADVASAAFSLIVTPDGDVDHVIAAGYAFAPAQAHDASLDDLGIEASAGSHTLSNARLTVPISTSGPGSSAADGGSTSPGTQSAFSPIAALSATARSANPKPVDSSGNATTTAPYAIGYLYGGDWLQYARVDFGAGAGAVTVNLAVPAGEAGQTIQFRLDSTTGTLIGALTTTATAGWGAFQQEAANLSATPTGVHDVYLVMVGTSGIANIQSFVFAQGSIGGGGKTGGGGGAPPQAAQVGYTLNTFHSGPFSATNVDMGDTGSPGFQWYFKQPFGAGDASPNDVTLNGDGSITLRTGINAFDPVSPWHGVGFGGGAYFEATFSFVPNASVDTAWWSMALEHFVGAGAGDQWLGMPAGYAHFIEADFFEYDTTFAGANTYGGAVHDWGGTYGSGGYEFNVANDGNAYVNDFVITVPANVDWSQPHKYGFLWVPATATSNGRAQYYFDGQPTTDSLTWTQYDCAQPPPGPAGLTPWTFGIIDCDHPALVLGSTAAAPQTVYSVDVWQASPAGNLTQ